jgi:hypothetical protein
MKNTIRTIRNGGLYAAALLVAVGSAACGAAASEDVAYEDDYAGDYYYPADVAYSGVYGGFGGYGYYAVVPAGTGPSGPLVAAVTDAAVALDAAAVTGAAGHTGTTSGAAGQTGTTSGAAGNPGTGAGATTVRGAVGQAIRNAALGGTACAGQVTVTPQSGTAVCGQSTAGVNIVFSGCQLSGGGTLDGTVNVQTTRSASDANCNASTSITIGYTSTITNLTYTGAGGAKIVIPNQMSTATLNFSFGQTPTTASIATNGEIQRFAGGGSMTSDRTYTGTQMFSAISLANQSYTVGGMMNITDKAGGTATLTGTGLARENSCCKPTGGTLSVSRSGGSHSGSHSWTFTSTCGSAMLDGKTVTLPACL